MAPQTRTDRHHAAHRCRLEPNEIMNYRGDLLLGGEQQNSRLLFLNRPEPVADKPTSQKDPSLFAVHTRFQGTEVNAINTITVSHSGSSAGLTRDPKWNRHKERRTEKSVFLGWRRGVLTKHGIKRGSVLFLFMRADVSLCSSTPVLNNRRGDDGSIMNTIGR